MFDEHQQQEGWRIGTPTRPAVERITEALGDLAIGDVIPYARISEIIGIEPTVYRWKTVTNAWRKKVWHENNLVIACENETFIVYDDSQRLTYGVKRVASGVKAVRKGAAVIAGCNTPKLTAEEQKVQQHYIRLTVQIDNIIQKEKQLTSPKAPRAVTEKKE